jgi:hypothetical protein
MNYYIFAFVIPVRNYLIVRVFFFLKKIDFRHLKFSKKNLARLQNHFKEKNQKNREFFLNLFQFLI